MKSKAKISKSDNTIIVDYFNVKNPFIFRYNMQKIIFQMHEEAVIFIDTNTKTHVPAKRIEAYLDENHIEYSMFKIKAVEKKILGILVSKFTKPKPRMTEKYIIAKIKNEMFTQQMFIDYLSTYDIAIGIEPTLSIEEMVEDYRENVFELFFDETQFKEFIYDSIIFTTFRSTIDTREFIEECEE